MIRYRILIFIAFISAVGFSQTQKNEAPHDTVRIPLIVKHKFPEPVGWINDFENDLDSTSKELISRLIFDHLGKTTNQIAIVTIQSYSPYDNLAEYASDLANEWGVGQKGKNNGLTIVMSKEKREVRIATGLGLESILTDAICKQIIDEKMIPQFKVGKFSDGLLDGLKEMIRILEAK